MSETSGSLLKKVYEKDKNPLAGQGLKYIHKWNSTDFIGKHHITYFDSMNYVTPGTQTNRELKHLADKKEDVERFEGAIQAYANKRNSRRKIRDKMIELSSGIEMKTRIGQPFDSIEGVLDKKHEVLRAPKPCTDSIHEIHRFYKSVCAGRHNYIGFAMTSGFTTIDYQDPDTGDSALHVCVRKGDLVTLTELLKYKANPELKNSLGNYPLHDAWYFHNFNPVGRSKEERLEQENKTCEIIHKILLYGGYPNVQDQQGATPLHIAVRYGHLRAVLLILGFKANHQIIDINGETAYDVAKKLDRQEIAYVLNKWQGVQKSYINADFTLTWRKFFREYNRPLTNQKSAEEVIFELDMEQSLNEVDRVVRTTYPIDDKLLRESYVHSKMFEENKVPLPWETDWKFFKKYCDEHKIFDKLTKLKDLDEQGYYRDTVARKKKDIVAENKDQEQSQKRDPNAVDTFQVPFDRPPTAPRPYSRGEYARGASSKDLPQKKNQEPRPRTGTSGEDKGGKGLTGVSRGEDKFGLVGVSRGEDKVGLVGVSRGEDKVGLIGDTESIVSSIGNNKQVMSPSSINNLEQNSIISDIAMDNESAVADLDEIDDFMQRSRPRTSCGLKERRMKLAQLVILDGKFNQFTKRPATSSAMLLPLRHAVAPYEGTEEEGNTRRILSSQGKDFDMVNTQVSTTRRFGGQAQKVPINTIGAYTKALDKIAGTAREELFAQVPIKPLTERELAELAVAKSSSNKMENRLANIKQEKVDTVNKDRRMRFVEKELVPPDVLMNDIQLMIQEKANKKEQERLRDLQGSEKALENVQDMIASAGDNSSITSGKKSVDTARSSLDTMAQERLNEQKKSFLVKTKIIYGKGRITSTFACKQKLPEPWSTVSNFYT